MPRGLFSKVISNSITLMVKINKHTHKAGGAKVQVFKHDSMETFHIQAIVDILQICHFMASMYTCMQINICSIFY